VQLEDVHQLIEAAGLTPRGAFHPNSEDAVPAMPGGRPVATLVLVGNAGPAMWRRFTAERSAATDALDAWSRDVIDGLAGACGAASFFPFARPFLPFQRWARRAGPCHPSPLGILIHPDYGLWHGYRGALGFAEVLKLPSPDLRPSPCDTCRNRPCLSACPAGAFDARAGYDVPACTGHLAAPAGEAGCMRYGCAARHACPAGRGYAYAPAQAEFHMRAFQAMARGGSGG
jgi:hypothetical protein